MDGFDPKTKIIYEFLGDYWHGNLRIKKYSTGTNKSNNTAFSILNKTTFERFDKLKAAGYDIFYVWESDFLNGNKGEFYE